MRALTWKTLAILALAMMMVSGEESAPESAPESEENNKTAEQPKSDFDATDHTDWGSYYDPKNEFCGKYDCYKILGFDYESFDGEHPDKKEITKRYRALSRAWHPDKSKHKDAKARFVVS